MPDSFRNTTKLESWTNKEEEQQREATTAKFKPSRCHDERSKSVAVRTRDIRSRVVFQISLRWNSSCEIVVWEEAEERYEEVTSIRSKKPFRASGRFHGTPAAIQRAVNAWEVSPRLFRWRRDLFMRGDIGTGAEPMIVFEFGGFVGGELIGTRLAVRLPRFAGPIGFIPQSWCVRTGTRTGFRPRSDDVAFPPSHAPR